MDDFVVMGSVQFEKTEERGRLRWSGNEERSSKKCKKKLVKYLQVWATSFLLPRLLTFSLSTLLHINKNINNSSNDNNDNDNNDNERRTELRME